LGSHTTESLVKIGPNLPAAEGEDQENALDTRDLGTSPERLLSFSHGNSGIDNHIVDIGTSYWMLANR